MFLDQRQMESSGVKSGQMCGTKLFALSSETGPGRHISESAAAGLKPDLEVFTTTLQGRATKEVDSRALPRLLPPL